ncbi:hypothetical protein [Oceanobacillus sojae]|uniref:Uncharacterized protein n=1 Tax=Oceanobacillus sojae TaxID=582851 RepID=A0A511ZLB9_9BACI|nr:hypothetical protein [Oceanobacillus sojae]GEN88262.1 hypothetical protein OSO01_30010 [Oceanobacillus sojae]
MLKNIFSKSKLLAACITSFNMGFVFTMITESASKEINTAFFTVASEVLLFSFLFSLWYIAPIVFLAGIPASAGIDKITSGIMNTEAGNTLRAVLHVLAGIVIALLAYFVLGGVFPDFNNREMIINFIFLSAYPSVFFWLIDTLANKKNTKA